MNLKYTGSTSLTAVGPITKARYRFVGHGAVVAVDSRDAPFLCGVPHLVPAATHPR